MQFNSTSLSSDHSEPMTPPSMHETKNAFNKQERRPTGRQGAVNAHSARRKAPAGSLGHGFRQRIDRYHGSGGILVLHVVVLSVFPFVDDIAGRVYVTLLIETNRTKYSVKLVAAQNFRDRLDAR